MLDNFENWGACVVCVCGHPTGRTARSRQRGGGPTRPMRGLNDDGGDDVIDERSDDEQRRRRSIQSRPVHPILSGHYSPSPSTARSSPSCPPPFPHHHHRHYRLRHVFFPIAARPLVRGVATGPRAAVTSPSTCSESGRCGRRAPRGRWAAGRAGTRHVAAGAVCLRTQRPSCADGGELRAAAGQRAATRRTAWCGITRCGHATGSCGAKGCVGKVTGHGSPRAFFDRQESGAPRLG